MRNLRRRSSLAEATRLLLLLLFGRSWCTNAPHPPLVAPRHPNQPRPRPSPSLDRGGRRPSLSPSVARLRCRDRLDDFTPDNGTPSVCCRFAFVCFSLSLRYFTTPSLAPVHQGENVPVAPKLLPSRGRASQTTSQTTSPLRLRLLYFSGAGVTNAGQRSRELGARHRAAPSTRHQHARQRRLGLPHTRPHTRLYNRRLVSDPTGVHLPRSARALHRGGPRG